MHQIASERRRQNIPVKDGNNSLAIASKDRNFAIGFSNELLSLKQSQEGTIVSTSSIKGYIQEINTAPFGYFLFSDIQVIKLDF